MKIILIKVNTLLNITFIFLQWLIKEILLLMSPNIYNNQQSSLGVSVIFIKGHLPWLSVTVSSFYNNYDRGKGFEY